MVTSYILISRSSFSWLHITSTNQLRSCAFGFWIYESRSWNSKSWSWTSESWQQVSS